MAISFKQFNELFLKFLVKMMKIKLSITRFCAGREGSSSRILFNPTASLWITNKIYMIMRKYGDIV